MILGYRPSGPSCDLIHGSPGTSQTSSRNLTAEVAARPIATAWRHGPWTIGGPDGVRTAAKWSDRDPHAVAKNQPAVLGGSTRERQRRFGITANGSAQLGDQAQRPCPDCGRPMVLRTARTGRNEGHQFWGCSGFPSCRAIVDLDSGGDRAGSVAVPQRVAWSDYGRRPGWLSFYAPAGGRLRAWDPLGSERVPATVRRSLSQAAFFMSEHEPPPLDERVRIALDVVRRLMSRGDRPPVDGIVESWILEQAGLGATTDPARDPGDLSRRLQPRAKVPAFDAVLAAATWREPFELDAEAQTANHEPIVDASGEEPFYRAATHGTLGTAAGHWITPQAALGPLTGSSGDHRRADFLVCHPLADPCIVEVDGAQHRYATEVDRDRDQATAASGVRTIRVSGLDDPGLAAERLRLSIPDGSTRQPASTLTVVWAPAVAARIARAVVEAIAAGWLRGQTWRLRIDEPIGIADVAVQSVVEILAAVARVWAAGMAPDAVSVEVDGSVGVLRRDGTGYKLERAPHDATPADVQILVEPFAGPWHRLPPTTDTPTIVVRSACLPVELRDGQSFGAFARRVPDIDAVDRAALTRILQAVFAKREFYPAGAEHPRGQEVAIRRILDGRDTAVLLPTGAGKSLIYQMAGLLLPGVTVVVDPIIALIDDQLEGLAGQGIDRAIGITGDDTRAGRTEAKLNAISAGDAIFSFVAPQRLQSRAFRDALRGLAVSTPISVAVVDEAHCVSEWGHTFMAAYLGLAHALRDIGRDRGNVPPPVLALTGTASRSVLRDMLVELEIDRSDPGAIVVPADFDRPELSYEVVTSGEDEVMARLVGTMRSLPGQFRRDASSFFAPNGPDTFSGIVFLQTVNPSRDRPDLGVLNVRDRLQASLGMPVGVYAGGAPRVFRGDWDEERRANARGFKQNELPVLVATKAFGMGIDKPNIRFTVHVGIPGSIEAFYQEAGRAGRDRHPAHCVVVHDPGDGGFWEWAHGGSFKGVDADVAAIARALRTIGELDGRRRCDIPLSSADGTRDTEERAVHRLRLLGVVKDYTIDWGGNKLELVLGDVTPDSLDAALIGYIRRTQPGRVAAFEKVLEAEPKDGLANQVLRNARHLVSFVYDTVANARVQALAGMQELAERARTDDDIRGRILRYLELGRVAGELEALIDQEPFRFDAWRDLYFRLDTVDDGREWRGATTRYLESSPDHPGLLLGRALAEAIVPEGDVKLFSSSLAGGLGSAVARYDTSPEEATAFAEWVVSWLHERKPAWSALAMLVSERSHTIRADTWRDAVERTVIRDTRIADPHELAMAYARIQDRYVTSLSAAATQAREMFEE